MNKQIASHVRELAEQVIPAEHLASFLALPLRSQLIGLAVFSHIGAEFVVRDECLAAAEAVAS